MNKYWTILAAALLLVSSLSYAKDKKAEAPSRKEAKAIAKKYIMAVNDGYYNEWAALMYSTNGMSRNFQKTKQSIVDIKRYKTHCSVRLNGFFCLQILPDKTIKYDNFFIVHPIREAMKSCIGLINLGDIKNNPKKFGVEKLYTEQLEATGIPLFGYDPGAPYSERRKALEKIREWLLDEGEEWDRDEPKIPCPEFMYENYQQSLESLKRVNWK